MTMRTSEVTIGPLLPRGYRPKPPTYPAALLKLLQLAKQIRFQSFGINPNTLVQRRRKHCNGTAVFLKSCRPTIKPGFDIDRFRLVVPPRAARTTGRVRFVWPHGKQL